MPRTIWLIRHAQSANNALAEHLRVPDPGLTPLGHEQALRLAERLHANPPTQLYCSGFLRSLETTRPVYERTGLLPEVRWDLFEQGGCYAGFPPGPLIGQPGMGASQIAERFPNWKLDPRISELGWWYGMEYESDDQAKRRAESVATWLASEPTMENQAAALVIHADFKKLLLEVMLPRESQVADWEDPSNTSVSQLVLSKGGWQLQNYNCTRHLSIECIT